MSERLTDEQLREWRDRYPDHPYAEQWSGKALTDEILAHRASVAKLEAALRVLCEDTKWKSVDKDNMEFEGRVTCYQLSQARDALVPPQSPESRSSTDTRSGTTKQER